jgi:class 3 adenylate cyclase/tetratricopeptide (TPR) repeat protein
MRCPSCSFSNPAASHFCGSCGSRLTRQCPACQSEVAPDLRFCTACGAALDAAAERPASPEHPPPAAELRLVSVLFLDLVGFTGLAESLDAEDVRELLSRYFEAARGSVARFGGTIEKFIGDAVMAVWGTPVAHEDDAERAVRAGLELVESVVLLGRELGGQPLAARAAVVTGEAAVTLGAEGQGMVAGDLVNTAARLQSTAEPGTLLADETTQRIAAGSIAFEPAGRRSLRGRAAELEVWRAVGPRLAAGPLSAGHQAPFVGREAELHALTEALRATAGERPLCRLISVSGIPGIGKSRLAWELERAAEEMPQTFAWHVGRAPAYGEGSDFAPLAEMVRRRIGVTEGQEAESTRRNLERLLSDLVPDAAEREWLEPRLMVLLGSREAVEGERDELFGAWRRFFEAVSDRWPSVLVFEDIQWAEEGLLDFIEHLAEWSRRRPILIVTLARPEMMDRRPTWGAGLPNFTALHIDRLPDQAMDQLLAGLAPDLPARAARRIRQRADGVPLYAVEMVRMLLDRSTPAGGAAGSELSKVKHIDIPDSLHALIAARIDGLPTEDRSLLLNAAVLGRRFHLDGLAEISGIGPAKLRTQLRSLVRREMLAIDDEPRSPGRGQVRFVQEMVRDVAYRTLSRRERRTRHLAAARFLASLDDEDLVEPLAEHLLAAHRLTPSDQPEARSIAQRARDALLASARRAMNLHVPGRALDDLERALALTQEEPARAELSEQAAAAARAAARFDVAERHLREVLEWHTKNGDRASVARTTARLASLLLVSQGNRAVLAELEQAWRDLGDLGDGAASGEIAGQLARACFVGGDLDGARTWADRALATAVPNSAVALDARVTRASARASAGLDEAARADLEHVIAAAERSGYLMVELRARNNLVVFQMLDNPRASLEGARRIMELARRTGNRDMVLQMVDVGVSAAIDPGEWDWALGAIAEAEEEEVPEVYRVDFAVARSILGALRGDEGDRAALESIEPVDPTIDPQNLAAVTYARACQALLDDRLSEAHELALGAAEGATAVEAWWSVALAIRASLWQGDGATARRLLARLRLPDGPGRAAEASVQTLTAGVQALGGNRSAAEEGYAEAAERLRELDLPLALGFCLLDRHLLLGDEVAGDEAGAIFERLGAPPLLARVRAQRAPA